MLEVMGDTPIVSNDTQIVEMFQERVLKHINEEV